MRTVWAGKHLQFFTDGASTKDTDKNLESFFHVDQQYLSCQQIRK